MWWWPFASEKTYKESGILDGFTDWHTHILPGVDDGVQNMDDALKILKQYEHSGVKDVWFTPHISKDNPNDTDSLRKRFDELQDTYMNKTKRGEDIPVNLHLASEYMLDSLLRERLKSDDLLPIGNDGKCLLVETSFAKAPDDLYEIIKEIQDAGYTPILAHPERYLYMHRPDYHKLNRGMNVEFQLNLPSLAGLNGPEARRRAKILLEAGYYSYVGTDIHNLHKFYAAVTEYKIHKKYLNKIKEIIESSSN